MAHAVDGKRLLACLAATLLNVLVPCGRRPLLRESPYTAPVGQLLHEPRSRGAHTGEEDQRPCGSDRFRVPARRESVASLHAGTPSGRTPPAARQSGRTHFRWRSAVARRCGSWRASSAVALADHAPARTPPLAVRDQGQGRLRPHRPSALRPFLGGGPARPGGARTAASLRGGGHQGCCTPSSTPATAAWARTVAVPRPIPPQNVLRRALTLVELADEPLVAELIRPPTRREPQAITDLHAAQVRVWAAWSTAWGSGVTTNLIRRRASAGDSLPTLQRAGAWTVSV